MFGELILVCAAKLEPGSPRRDLHEAPAPNPVSGAFCFKGTFQFSEAQAVAS